jgi:hypothetical protein
MAATNAQVIIKENTTIAASAIRTASTGLALSGDNNDEAFRK